MAATIATPKPDILNASPNNESAIFNVIALITIKKNPKVTTVIGSVIKIKNGFTNTFKTANIILAIIAVVYLLRKTRQVQSLLKVPIQRLTQRYLQEVIQSISFLYTSF